MCQGRSVIEIFEEDTLDHVVSIRKTADSEKIRHAAKEVLPSQPNSKLRSELIIIVPAEHSLVADIGNPLAKQKPRNIMVPQTRSS